MAISTTLLAKILGGIGVVAAATVVGVTANRGKTGDTKEQPKGEVKQSTPKDPLKELNEKIKKLGIEGCELGNGENTKTCDLDKEKIGKVKFDGKAEGASVSESASLTLKIEKGYESLNFPEGLRFSFTNSSGNDITIGEASNPITFKSKTTYDYKIKTSDNTTTLEKAWDLATLNEIAGLQECTTASGGDSITECSFRTGSVNVWRNENDYLTGGGAASGSTNKKMKVTKDSAGYRQGLKFSLEEEISLITTSLNSKTYILSPNTNYEIDIKDIGNGKSWFLIDKTNEDLNEKIKNLGITNCKLENGQTKTSECELDETKVKAIKFSNKQESSDLTVSGLNPDKKLVLVIERDYKNDEFPSGLRFTFTNKNTEDVTIGSSPSPITLKANTSYDFKIKTEGNNETKLEKAWTLTTLAAKVGLTCTNGDTNPQCDISTDGLSFWTSDTDYLTQLKSSETDKKITITKDQQNYFEGLKFTVSQDITLTSANPTKSLQLTQEGKSYEISPKDVSGAKKWFLVEKKNT